MHDHRIDRGEHAEHAHDAGHEAATHDAPHRPLPVHGGHLPPHTTGVHPHVASASDRAFDHAQPVHHTAEHTAEHPQSAHHGHGHPKPTHHGTEHPQSAHHPHPQHAAGGLQLGATGPEVIEIQQQLRAAGYYHAAIGGHFGPQTEAALRAFQREHGLPDTGTADATTLDALRTATPAAPAEAPPAAGGLQLGASGPEVVALQQQLHAAGYYNAALGGHYGPQTEAAVRAFQRAHGLTDTGVADAATVDALRTATPAPAASAPTQGPAEDVPPATGAAAAIAYGMSVLGAPYAAVNPYRFGNVPWPGGSMVDIHDKVRGPFPKGTQVFDCSGFVVTCWQHGGVNLMSHGLGDSHSIGKDKTFLHDVTADQLQPGDMIVDEGHIVLYIGGGQVIQSTPNGGVKVSDASSYLDKAVALKRVPG